MWGLIDKYKMRFIKPGNIVMYTCRAKTEHRNIPRPCKIIQVKHGIIFNYAKFELLEKSWDYEFHLNNWAPVVNTFFSKMKEEEKASYL